MHRVAGEITPEFVLEVLLVDREVTGDLPLLQILTVSIERLGAELLEDDPATVLAVEPSARMPRRTSST
jgi:hypothetical protein